MNIKFKCPTCKVSLEAEESVAGELVKCPNCNNSIIIPNSHKQVKSSNNVIATNNSNSNNILEVKTYLPLAITSTFCCCIPLGMVAIFYAAKTSAFIESNEINSALDASKKAKKWVTIAVTCGIIAYTLNAIVTIVLRIANN